MATGSRRELIKFRESGKFANSRRRFELTSAKYLPVGPRNGWEFGEKYRIPSRISAIRKYADLRASQKYCRKFEKCWKFGKNREFAALFWIPIGAIFACSDSENGRGSGNKMENSQSYYEFRLACEAKTLLRIRKMLEIREFSAMFWIPSGSIFSWADSKMGGNW